MGGARPRGARRPRHAGRASRRGGGRQRRYSALPGLHKRRRRTGRLCGRRGSRNVVARDAGDRSPPQPPPRLVPLRVSLRSALSTSLPVPSTGIGALSATHPACPFRTAHHNSFLPPPPPRHTCSAHFNLVHYYSPYRHPPHLLAIIPAAVARHPRPVTEHHTTQTQHHSNPRSAPAGSLSRSSYRTPRHPANPQSHNDSDNVDHPGFAYHPIATPFHVRPPT